MGGIHVELLHVVDSGGGGGAHVDVSGQGVVFGSEGTYVDAPYSVDSGGAHAGEVSQGVDSSGGAHAEEVSQGVDSSGGAHAEEVSQGVVTTDVEQLVHWTVTYVVLEYLSVAVKICSQFGWVE
jgi:hypothetical protein